MKNPDHYIRKGFGHLSFSTLAEYHKKFKKYNELRGRGRTHSEACDMIGVSDRHMDRIKQVCNL